jgi:hypothetical protein
VTVFYPFPGTVLHEECARAGLLTGRTKPSYLEGDSTLALPSFPARELRKYHRRLRSMSFGRELRWRWPWLLPAYRALERLGEPLGISVADLLIRLRHRVVVPLLGR